MATVEDNNIVAVLNIVDLTVKLNRFESNRNYFWRIGMHYWEPETRTGVLDDNKGSVWPRVGLKHLSLGTTSM